MLSTGARPYHDKSHDKQLIQEICSGLRPNVISGTPPVFASLMLQCLDADPSNRPTASQLYECLGNWITAICDDPSLIRQIYQINLMLPKKLNSQM
jgi:hypothetical protein